MTLFRVGLFRILAVCSLVLESSASSAAEQVTTIVGTGIPGYSGDSGPATAAMVKEPAGIAYDGAGNLYISDSMNFRIRKVSAATGIITTIAGTGVSGYSGDGGAGTLAMMSAPIGIGVTAIGSVFIADISNHRVRAVSSSGIISTIAGNGLIGFSGDGGLALNARLNTPQGVARDLQGNIYVADTANSRLRRVDFLTGVITTIAGTGIPTSTGDGGLATGATLTSPRRIAVDRSDNIFIVDMSTNPRIRRISAVTGIITTVVGGGATVADSGLATDLRFPNLTDMIVMDDTLIVTTTLKAYRVSNGIAVKIAGVEPGGYGGDGGDPRLAAFNGIYGVAVNDMREVTLSDRFNARIRWISSTSTSGVGYEPSPTFVVQPNLPNPFHRSTSLRFHLSRRSAVSVRIFDVEGRLARTLQSQSEMEPGDHALDWDGRLQGGGGADPGVYFYEVRAGEFRSVGKMTKSR